MLYHFPEESPEKLLKQNGDYLEKQYENAKHVEKYGYRRKESTLPSFFIEWQCTHKYLGCQIEKWSLPLTSKDKVELEPLPSDFLPFIEQLLKPLKYFDPDSNNYVRRVVGFREIQKKREYLEYLREIETEMGSFNDDDEDDDEGERKILDSVQIEIDDGNENKENVETCGFFNVGSEGEKVTMDSLEDKTYYKAQPFLRLSLGGGKKEKHHDKKKRKEKGKHMEKDKHKGAKHSQESQQSGIVGKILDYFTDTPSDKKGKIKKQDKKKKKMEESSSKKENDQTKGKRKNSMLGHQGWGVAHLWKDLEKQKALMEKENQENLEQIFKYHSMFRVKPAKERDSEWLELSDTDPEDLKTEIKTFEKPITAWMKEGISFESQYLARTLLTFRICSWAVGRSFINVKPDKHKGHMDFTHRKKDTILFFITSIVLWICFCLMTISFLDILMENESKRGKISGNVKDTEITPEKLEKQANKARHEVEELQLNLYEIPLYVFVINLVLVAFWSVLIILGDGIYIAHYVNCWCAALAEMETSGCLGLKKLIIMHHADFFFYVVIMGALFYFDYPAHVRQSNLLIAALILRPLKPDLRLEGGDNLIYYQIGGLLFQLYVVYCTVLIKLIMKILATILKNASEMWNFKFALTFQQLATKNRGQLLRMSLNHSLLKLFTHHRILTVLLRNYGEVFAVPIMIHMVSEMGVITVALVRWFFYKVDTAQAYGGHSEVIIQTLRTNHKTGKKDREDDVVIPYFHTQAEVHVMLYLLMFQCLIQFINTTDLLAKAGDSVRATTTKHMKYFLLDMNSSAGVAPFVVAMLINDAWLVLAQLALPEFNELWNTNPSVLSANSYFTINRATILASFAAVAGFFSLIIQLQVQVAHKQISFNTIEECAKINEELVLGACMPNPRHEGDPSLSFVGNTTK